MDQGRLPLSDKLQFVARYDKLKLIAHQTDPLQVVPKFGVRRQSEAATALWIDLEQI